MRGETACETYVCQQLGTFQSTPLMRGETESPPFLLQFFQFQSTPLMRGETQRALVWGGLSFDFNPLPSCEGRHNIFVGLLIFYKFQSTPLMRGETIAQSIIDIRNIYFNPLPSCEGRHY